MMAPFGVGAIISSGRSMPPGMGSLGKPSCHRIIIASNPPTTRKNRLIRRNWMAMVLWSVEKM